MIKAVLFDLDDTLLDINFTAFMTRYVAGLSGLLGDISRTPAPLMGVPFTRGYLAMEDDPAIADAIDCYEREFVPAMRGGIVAARPQRGGRQAVDVVHELGLTCALATNPAFSEACVEARMGWANVSPEDFVRISNWDNAYRLKPNARFYQEFVNSLGLTCDECLMVGNDSRRDFARPDCGLRTIYVGHATSSGGLTARRPTSVTWPRSSATVSSNRAQSRAQQRLEGPWIAAPTTPISTS